MVSGNDIRQRIMDAWKVADGIDQEAVLFQYGKKQVVGGFTWVPSSVDPTSHVRYGCAIGPVEPPFAGSPNWLVQIYIGPVNDNPESGGWITDDFASIPMIFDGKGKLTDTWELEIWTDDKLQSKIDLPVIPAFPFLPPTANTAIAVYSLVILVGNWLLTKFPTDTTAAKLSIAPLAGLLIAQTAYGVRAAFTGDKPADLKSKWSRYDAAIQGWDQAKGWKDKGGNAREYDGEGGVPVRMWRPEVFLDGDTWSIHVKFDRRRTLAHDDHLIVTATARRSSQRKLVTLTAVGELIATGKTFAFATDTKKDGDDDDVFSRWGDRLVVEMSSETALQNFARTIIAAMNPLMKTIARAEGG